VACQREVEQHRRHEQYERGQLSAGGIGEERAEIRAQRRNPYQRAHSDEQQKIERDEEVVHREREKAAPEQCE
jgi:hypothetical protein